MILDRVTITGADDSVRPADLVVLSREFPFVEWGILVSKTREGRPRFPGRWWIRELVTATKAFEPMRLSLHVCGEWVRRLMVGGHDVFVAFDEEIDAFQRVQLNFFAEHHEVHLAAAAGVMLVEAKDRQFIVQMDGTKNDEILGFLRVAGVDAVPLFDTSGGTGSVPRKWPRPSPVRPYHGYAGGLGPDNLGTELRRIEAAADLGPGAPVTRVWIDMERRVRSEDDWQFDLAKVRAVLAYCAPRITTNG